MEYFCIFLSTFTKKVFRLDEAVCHLLTWTDISVTQRILSYYFSKLGESVCATSSISPFYLSVGTSTMTDWAKNVLQKKTVSSSPLILIDSQFGVALQSTKETKPENVPWEQA